MLREGAVDDAGGIFAGLDGIEGEAEGAECLLMFAGEDGGAIESPFLIREVEVVEWRSCDGRWNRRCCTSACGTCRDWTPRGRG